MSSNGEFLLFGSAFVGDEVEANHVYTSIMNDLRDVFGTYGPGWYGTDLMIYPAHETRLNLENSENGMPTLAHDRRHIKSLIAHQGEFDWYTEAIVDIINKMRKIRDICAKYNVTVYYMNEYNVVQDQQDLTAGINSGDIIELTEENILRWESQIKKS